MTKDSQSYQDTVLKPISKASGYLLVTILVTIISASCSDDICETSDPTGSEAEGISLCTQAGVETDTVLLFPASTESLDLIVDPSLPELNCDIYTDSCEIRLAPYDPDRKGLTSGNNILYRLKKIVPTSDTRGEIIQGSYTVYFEDWAKGKAYQDKMVFEIVRRTADGQTLIDDSRPFIITSGNLPVVLIDTPGKSEINSKLDWTHGCSISIATPDGLQDLYADDVDVRGRGNSSWNWFPKKPYNIRFKNDESVLGMPAGKRWILLANWMDRTLIRNATGLEIARTTSLEWTPSGRFVELVMNGKHVGNYYLTEKVEFGKNRLDREGGYLLTLDTSYDEQCKFKTSYRNLPVNIKEPDDDSLTAEQFNYVKDYLDHLEEILYGKDIDNEDYKDYIDVQSFCDWYIVQELTWNHEPNNPRSCYFYISKEGRLYAGPCWDYDWGTFLPDVDGFQISQSLWFDKLLEDPSFQKALKTRWTLLKPMLIAMIPPYIQEQADIVDVSEKMNHQMWPIDFHNVNGDDYMEWAMAVQRMENAYSQRIESLDKAINGLIGIVNSDLVE